MAPFNPEIKPTNDPKYGNDFRPINPEDTIKPRGVETNTIMPEGQKIGDKSAEYAGQAAAYGMQAEGQGMAGIGKLFENVASIGNTLAQAGVNIVKKDIEDKVYDAANRTRQEYTDMLERIKTNVGTKNLLDANASADMPDDSADTPDEIVGLGSHLAGLASARDAGKISGTYYAGRLLAEAKDLRARYPGFRQEIDEQFARVTGMNPANAYIKSMVMDINRAVSSTSSNRLKTELWIRNNFLGTPKGEEVLNKFRSGEYDETKVYQELAPYKREEEELKMRHLKFQDQELTDKEKAKRANNNLDYTIGVTVGRATESLLKRMGLNTEADVSRLDTLSKNGGVTAQQWLEWGQEGRKQFALLRHQLIQDADRYGYTQPAGGKAEVIKRIDEGLKPLQGVIDMADARDAGAAFNAGRSIVAMRDQDTLDLLKDSKVGPAFRQAQVNRNVYGDQWMAKFQLEMATGNENIPKEYREYYKAWKGRIVTGNSQAAARGESPLTFNDMADEFNTKGVVSKEMNNKMLRSVSLIGDKNTPDEAKISIAEAAFSQGNRGFIGRLSADGIDSMGRRITGQNAIYQMFTSPEVTKEMYRLGQSRPELWTNYVNWAQETLVSDLMSKEVNQMKAVPANSNVKIGWDGENKRFQTIDNRPPDIVAMENKARGGKGTEGNTYFNQVDTMVNRMNNNLYNFKRIAANTGQDVDAFVLKTIADYAGRDALQNVEGIPFDLVRSIGLSRMRNKNPSGGQH